MKKLCVSLFTIILLLTSCFSAYATDFVNSLCATEEKIYTSIDDYWIASTTGKVCIYHTVDGTSNPYTNHFRVYVGTSNSASANKWVTPAMNISISCNDIGKNSKVTLKARGNTAYRASYDDDYITVRGTYGKPIQ